MFTRTVRQNRVALAALVGGALLLPRSGARAEETPDPNWLREHLEKVVEGDHIPAVAVAVVIDGKVVAASAAGHRKLGAEPRARRNDPFQLCSVTKSMTATLIGELVDREKMRWDMTIAEMFPELEKTTRAAYHKVTVVELLAHLSGMPYEPRTPESVTDGRATTTLGRRYEYVRAALEDKPEAPPGTKFIYGGGPILVACAAERITHTPYEELMHRHVFRPLDMTTAGFGCNATPGTIDAPWEHELEKGHLKPVPPTEAMKHQARSPVGRNVHCSAIDLGRFAALHLKGARGESKFLRPETFEKLYTPVPPTKNAGLGFFRNKTKGFKGDVLTHNGGNGTSCSVYMIAPGENVAACVLMNRGDDVACKARDELCQRLLEMAKEGKFAKD
jgi:CubicO group peptidase (beta-lactamase class C family)